MIEDWSPQVAAWVTSEWLEPHEFVNFDETEWSTQESWKELCDDNDIEPEHSEVFQWFSVNECFGRHAPATEVCFQLAGSGSYIWGRGGAGQAIYMDGQVFEIMVESGHLRYVPPLGLLRKDTDHSWPRLKIKLDGSSYPFRVERYASGDVGIFQNWLSDDALKAGARLEWQLVTRFDFDNRSSCEEWGFRITWDKESKDPIFPREIA